GKPARPVSVPPQNSCTCTISAELHGRLRCLQTRPAPSITPQMSGIRTNAAAVMLGVSPNTLRSWERRYGFPRPHRSPGGHRHYARPEVDSLRLTLAEPPNASSPTALARDRGEGPPPPARLPGPLGAFDEA